MVKLKLQYFCHVMRRVDSLEKTLMLGGIGGRRKRGQQRMRLNVVKGPGKTIFFHKDSSESLGLQGDPTSPF